LFRNKRVGHGDPALTSVDPCSWESMGRDVRGIGEHLAISERHVRRLVLERRIPLRKIGSLLRFGVGEVDAWMDTLRRGPALESGRSTGRVSRRSWTA
jgi:excisionase family DNA binding protein